MTIFVGGNQIQLLKNGAEYFPALLTAINAATNEIHLQTYIFQDDDTGIEVGNALINAAQRGVSVNLLLDGFGSKNLSKAYINMLEQSGVLVMFYRPKISPWSLKKRRLQRLHHKIALIDERVAFVGGINIIDDNDVPNNTPPRIDYAVRVEGELLVSITAIVERLWRRIAWIHFKHINPYIPSQTKQPSAASNQSHQMAAALVVRDNVLHRSDIEDAYLNAIQIATKEIVIANAYFVPGRKFRQALIAAAKRGVTIKLLLQGRMEYFVLFATHAFYNDFLSAGIEIYEYKKSFMHSKVAVIDGVWATVGSSNIDPFSLLLAREANIIVKDTQFAAELRTHIEASIQDGALRINPNQWAEGSMIKRLSSWIAYGLVRLFLGAIGHSNER